MWPTAQKEQFSLSYLHALASAAGLSLTVVAVDDDSVDAQLRAKGSWGEVYSPQLDVQLKCTETVILGGPTFSFQLKRKNFDELSVDNASTPRVLVVMRVPTTVDDWCAVTEDESLLRHSAYWASLKGKTSTAQSSVTVQIERSKLLTPSELRNAIAAEHGVIAP